MEREKRKFSLPPSSVITATVVEGPGNRAEPKRIEYNREAQTNKLIWR